MPIKCDKCKCKVSVVMYDRKLGLYLCNSCLNNKGKVR